tara:strand:- start:198 stop:353 length:156 start_codon:yes stop_codon:yes gene_type:complete
MDNQSVALFVRINKKYEIWLREQAKQEGRTLGKQFERICQEAQEQESEQKQ